MLKKNELNHFTYTKKIGQVSERDVYIVSVPSNKYFGIDLTEFSEAEKEIYVAELEEIYRHYKQKLEAEIQMLGLSSCYRNFLESGVSDS